MLQYFWAWTRWTFVICMHSVRGQLSFVCTSPMHVVHHISLHQMVRFLIVYCRCSIFSSIISVIKEVDGLTSSNSTCYAFCNASSQLVILYRHNKDMILGSSPTTYHGTSRFLSIVDGIWLKRSLNYLSYSLTDSPSLFLISFSFCAARCVMSWILKNVWKLLFISTFEQVCFLV